MLCGTLKVNNGPTVHLSGTYTLYVPLTTVTSSSFLTGTAPTCNENDSCQQSFSCLKTPIHRYSKVELFARLSTSLLTVYFVRNSLDRGALISFLLTLEGAEKWAWKETQHYCIIAGLQSHCLCSPYLMLMYSITI